MMKMKVHTLIALFLLPAASMLGQANNGTAPRLIADGYVKDLRQTKDASVLGKQITAGSTVYSGCLAADNHIQIPVKAGKRYAVTAAISTRCDARGWSCDNWATRSGPEGVAGYFVQGSLGYPASPIGALIGAVSAIDAAGPMDPSKATSIFAPAFHVGSRRDDRAPITGFLYLMFNDTWSWGDNKGSIDVTVQLFD